MNKKRIKFDSVFPYLMCLPAVILFTVVCIVAFGQGIYTSFYQWDDLGKMK